MVVKDCPDCACGEIGFVCANAISAVRSAIAIRHTTARMDGKHRIEQPDMNHSNWRYQYMTPLVQAGLEPRQILFRGPAGHLSSCVKFRSMTRTQEGLIRLRL